MKKFFAIILVTLGAIALIIAANAEDKWDLSDVTEVYRNSFDNEDSLLEFTQYGGKWVVKNGQLYLTYGGNTHPFIIYTGDESLSKLDNYVLDVDMYNTRTQGGVIIRSNTDMVTSGSNGFAGYFAFISFDGQKGALAFGNKVGGYGGNLEVSKEVTAPCSDLHLQVIAYGNELCYTITDLASGTVLWQHTETHSDWERGTFGFRMSAATYNGFSNLNTTSFDNLVISTFPEDDANEDAAENIIETIDDEWLESEDSAIAKTASRVIPVLWFAEKCGATVEWDVVNGIIRFEMNSGIVEGEGSTNSANDIWSMLWGNLIPYTQTE